MNWIIFYDENNIPKEIVKDLQHLCQLYGQAVCNRDKCREFSEILSELLLRLENMKFCKPADRLMSILMNWKPKEASHCEKTNTVESMMKEVKRVYKKAVKLKNRRCQRNYNLFLKFNSQNLNRFNYICEFFLLFSKLLVVPLKNEKTRFLLMRI